MDIVSLIDDALEISVVGSFSRIGLQVRQRIFGWESPLDGSLAGRTALVTGPTSGLGRETAGQLASLGARVVLVGRSATKLTAVRDELVAEVGEDRFPIVVADMGSLASVRVAVAKVLATEERLDVVVDNAGAIYPDRIIGPDGIEATLAIMAVAPFVLISGLLPLLERTGDARVICVTSGGMYTQAIDLDDLQWETEPFSGPRAYARVKRVQVTLIREWARRLRAAGHSGVAVNAMHPGWADTPGLAEQLPGFYATMRPALRSAAEGVDTIVWLATAAAAGEGGGKLYLDRRPRPFDRVPRTRLSAADRRRLWDIVVGLTGDPDPIAGA
jgi:dehydrogenase/reductase SDR family protein 12